MANLTLETIPYDMVVATLSAFGNFNDLYALLSSSPVCYRLFKRYRNSVLTAVAQNIIGKDAWEDVSGLLVYQREIYGISPNIAVIKKDLDAEFVWRKCDLSQFVLNQRVYSTCNNDELYSSVVSYHYPKIQIPESASSAVFPSSLAMIRPCPSLIDGDVLPINLFYKLWLLSLRFEYETIDTFAHHKPSSIQQCADLQLVARVMFCSTFKHLFSPERFRDLGPIVAPSRGLIYLWGTESRIFEPLGRLQVEKSNPMLFMKMRLHTSCATHHDSLKHLEIMTNLLRDYPKMSLEALIWKYELDKGWDTWPISVREVDLKFRFCWKGDWMRWNQTRRGFPPGVELPI